MSQARVTSSGSMVVQNSSLTMSATQVRNLLVSSLGLDTKDKAYIDNIDNFKMYSSNFKLPDFRW